MKKNKSGNGEDLNFWQPASDMFSALLLIMMLVILLLSLYLVYTPENDQPDPYAGDTWEGSIDEGDDEPYATPTFTLWSVGGDGGGEITPYPTYYPESTASPTETPSPTPSPTPDLPGAGGGNGGGYGGGNGEGEGPGEEPDVGMKSAVYVMLVDAETDRTVKEGQVEFELYGLDNALQILNTYYPDRVTYRMFETTDAGTFYLPEKLLWGEYELHELTEPEGYDAAENVPFILNAMYDWPEPLVVRVPVTPSRNIVRVQMNDLNSGLPVEGGTFEVIAAESIITADGTLRYRAGQVASEITCDETGYGESEEIYLGNYYLRQKDIPAFYAGLQDTIDVAVEKKSDVLPPITVIDCERTAIRVTLTDELYPTRTISGVSYRVYSSRGGTGMQEVTTNNSGTILLDELDKGVTYRFRQVEPAEGYQADSQEYTVAISADGRINGDVLGELQITNRMIRAQIGITDEFSSIQIPGINLALYSSDGTLIRTWTTSGSKVTFNGLEPGAYYIIRDGDTDTRFDLRIANQPEIQEINLHTSYVLGYIVIGGSAALAALLIILLIRRLRRRRKKQEPAA